MRKFLSPYIYKANTRAEHPAPVQDLERVSATEAGFKEKWLQAAIAAEPMLVMAPYLEANELATKWMYWASEVPTSAGRIDILLVSEEGRVAIVETKLSYNPERRRSVIAQVLDYASSLQEKSLEELPALPRGSDGKPLVTPEVVWERIEEGDLLLMIVADQLAPGAVRIGKSLEGENLTRGWELVLVEVGAFAGGDSKETGHYYLVPHLRGVVEPYERQCIRITLDKNEHRVKIVREEPVESSAGQLEAVAAAFDARAFDGLVTKGNGRVYRQVRPPRWPAVVHYEFLWTKQGRVSAELHFEADRFKPVAALVKERIPTLQSKLPGLTWDSSWSSNRGALRVELPPGASPVSGAQVMVDLIALTRQLVQEALESGGLLTDE